MTQQNVSETVEKIKMFSREMKKRSEKHQQGSQTHHAAIVSNEKRSKPSHQNYQKDKNKKSNVRALLFYAPKLLYS